MELVFFLVFSMGWAQDSLWVSTASILETAFEDPTHTEMNERIAYYQNNSNHIGYLDHMELRTRTRNFNPNEQMLRFRTYTNSPSERKYNKEYLKTAYAEQEIEKKSNLNKILLRRYQLVNSKYNDQKLISKMDDLGTLLEERKAVLEISSANLDFDFQDLLEAEEELDHFHIEMIQQQRYTEQIDKEIEHLLGIKGKPRIIVDDMVTIAGIESFLSHFKLNIEKGNFRFEQQQLNKRLAELEFLEKRASERNPVKFLEASYRDEPGFALERTLSIGIGFRIPIGSAGKGSLLERQFEIMEEESKLRQTSAQLTDAVQEKTNQLQTLIKQFNTLSGMIENSLHQKSLEKYSSMEGLSPLVLLKIKENILRKERMLIGLEKDIFIAYLDLLDLTGMLVREPMINYFSTKQLMDLIN